MPRSWPLEPAHYTLTMTPQGMGDCVCLMDLERAASLAGKTAHVWSAAYPFSVVRHFNPYHRDGQTPMWISLTAAEASYDIGPGHNIQKARRIFGLPVDTVPSGCLNAGVHKDPRRVSLHFEAGVHAQTQRRTVHPRAREIYPKTFEALSCFIKAHPELRFIEVGSSPSLRELVPNICGVSLEETVRTMATCSLHIGITSGPYHLATALGLRTILIINFPDPWELMMPMIKNIDTIEGEWCYPQSHILHQDHDSAHWPLATADNFERAYHKEIYPYDNPQEFLDLVNR